METKSAEPRQLSQIFKHENDISKADALKICSDHLKGSWAQITEDDLNMTIIQKGGTGGGSIQSSSPSEDQEVNRVILRLYGGKILDKASDDNVLKAYGEVGEVLVYYIMAHEGLGPTILGVFSGGRLEEYIPSRIISNDDLLDPAVTAAFARKLARIHSLNPPFSKEPKDVLTLIRCVSTDQMPEFKDGLRQQEVPKGSEAAAQMVLDFDFAELSQYLEQTIHEIKKRVVFSHNDMNRANCLIKTDDETASPDERVILIDYEFSCYNYRGCDLGNHFKQREFDVTKMTAGQMTEDGFHSGMKYPSEEERRYFIRAYLAEIKRIGRLEYNPELDTEDVILLESEFFGLAYQTFFLCWMIRDREKFKHMDMEGVMGQFNVFLLFADSINSIKERRASVNSLMGIQ